MPPLTFFEVEVEVEVEVEAEVEIDFDAVELGEPSFCEAPEGLNTVNMNAIFGALPSISSRKPGTKTASKSAEKQPLGTTAT